MEAHEVSVWKPIHGALGLLGEEYIEKLEGSSKIDLLPLYN